ncbi:MAG: [NiFe]-hydrogenase assembly chaperone HybE, partial [Gammaproteobacteria bacterium]|nr:[NiFe]-hydrogenase assembly chaperone HybE [Gammaproteobacteria bacterium]
SNSYKCMVNQVDGIGYYQSHSLHSPMHEFQSQEHALAAAESFMQLLMTEVERPDLDPHDEELL